MAINYNPVGWDPTKYFGPTNMNHMDDGIKAACDGVDKLTTEVAAVNESLEKKSLNTYTTFSQINEEYSASNFVYCNMPNNSTLSISLSAASGENGFANALIPVSSGGTLFVERIGGRGRIEYRDTSRNVHYAYVSDFSKITSNSNVVWDSYALNSDLLTVDLAVNGLNMQPNVDTKLGNVTIPSGYIIVSTDYIADGVNGGTGWGSLILHSTTSGTIYGMSLATITNSSGVIRVLCKKN